MDSLTQQQLRDIYAGKITNWSEVGGRNEEIVPYQRNRDSGSQNYMTTFMGDTPLMDAPSEYRPGSMAGLMDVIAVNDHASRSIGYSVYAYAADMYEGGDRIKFLAVDGVAPSKETMASGEYPLISENYAVFRADEPEDSPVRRLCDWMISDEGQLAIARAGYVTVRDIGFDYSVEALPEGYSGVGAGRPSWKSPPLFVSRAYNKENPGQLGLPLKVTLPENVVFSDEGGMQPFTTGIKYEITCINDTATQQAVNEWISGAVSRADGRSDELYAHILKCNGGDPESYMYGQNPVWTDNGRYYPSAEVTVKAKNGYLWATVAQYYWLNAQDGYAKYYRTECQTWDLNTGKALTTEGLFREGLDIDDFLNNFLRRASQSKIDAYVYPQMKQDFVRLPKEGWSITPEAIYIDYGDPYFAEGMRFPLENEAGVLCAEGFRGMEYSLSSIEVETGTMLAEAPYEPTHTFLHEAYGGGPLYTVELLDETVGNREIRAAINADMLRHLENISVEGARQYYAAYALSSPISEETFYSMMYGIYLTEYSDRLAIFDGNGMFALPLQNGGDQSWPEAMQARIYDLQTGEQLAWTDLLKDGWERMAQVTVYGPDYEEMPFEGDLSALTLPDRISLSGLGLRPVTIGFIENKQDGRYTYEVRLPFSSLKLSEEPPEDYRETALYKEAVAKPSVISYNGEPVTYRNPVDDFIEAVEQKRDGELYFYNFMLSDGDDRLYYAHFVSDKGKVAHSTDYLYSWEDALNPSTYGIDKVDLTDYGYLVYEGESSSEPSSHKVISDHDLFADAQERQDLYDTYLRPIFYTALGSGGWSSLTEVGSLIWLYEDIFNYEMGISPFNVYGTDWPVEEMVKLLNRYFDGVTQQMIINSHRVEDYDAATGTIHYEGGRGGLAPSYRITDWRQEGNILSLDYESYDFVTGIPYEDASYVLTVRLMEDGSFRYLSNQTATR